MTFSTLLSACVSFCFSILLLTACTMPESCSIVLGTHYEGEGVLVLKENVAQDGLVMVSFYPMCYVDTLHLLQSLQQAPEGVIFSASHRKIIAAIRHRSTVLLARDKRYPLPNRRIYVTSVHVAFWDTANTQSRKSFNYLLDTEQARIEHPVRFIENVHFDSFHGI